MARNSMHPSGRCAPAGVNLGLLTWPPDCVMVNIHCGISLPMRLALLTLLALMWSLPAGAAGFQRAPGVPVVIIRAAAGGPITRNKTAATLCTCGAADIGVPAFDGAPITDWAGPIELRVRGGTNTRKGAGEGRGERDGEAQGPPPVAPRKPSSLTAAAHPHTHPAPHTHTEMYNTILQYAATLPKAAAEGGANGTAATPAPAAPHPPPTHLLGLAGSPVLFMGQVNDTAGLKESLGRDLARAMGWAGPGAPPLPPAALASPYATWAAPAGPLGWVPRTVSVELFIVGGGAALGATPTQYRGLYLASEHVSKGKGKLDLSAPPPPGGTRTPAIATFLHGEKDAEATPILGRATGKEWSVKWPAADKLSPAQAAALGADLNGFEAALFGGATNATGAGVAAPPAGDWRAWMDDGAFTDWFLLQELWKTAKKAYHSAAFMVGKKREGGGAGVDGGGWEGGEGEGRGKKRSTSPGFGRSFSFFLPLTLFPRPSFPLLVLFCRPSGRRTRGGRWARCGPSSR